MEDDANPRWEWQNPYGWASYDPETSDIIEEAYQNKRSVVRLVHGFYGAGGGYTVNLHSMSQMRDSTANSRPIRRIPEAVPIKPPATKQPRYHQHAFTNPFGFGASMHSQVTTITCRNPQVRSEIQEAYYLFSRNVDNVETAAAVVIDINL
eukprot:TRINITY_DN590_c0_g1_i1.p1 TRINITY_DN590_c0_g1~~TRINITY_DN590_c0_g1_i1.p1  ORF type:complete len:158 (-),score=14.88 TRINITY_DN590_c0_g1_i1:79-531(-)